MFYNSVYITLTSIFMSRDTIIVINQLYLYANVNIITTKV
jgi:hypothetical protein